MKIFIADDHPIFRQGLLKIIEADPDVQIVGESGDGEEALQLIRSLSPDIAVLDISMPGMSGLEIVSEAQKESLMVEFIILTMFDEEEYFNEAMELGVKGYLLKENATSDLINCLRAVEKGKHYVSPMISDYLIKRRERTKAITEKVPSIQDLTEMEKRVLRLLAENKTSKEIAAELFISYRTVQNHRNNIANKLNLKGANKLLQFAIENKIYLSSAVDSGIEPETIEHPVTAKAKFNLKNPAILLGLASVFVLMASAFYFLTNLDKFDPGFQNENSVLGKINLDKNRVAVLPFTNISLEPVDDFLSDGLTGELITTLSQINGLRVIASTTVMKYKGTSKGISEISKELKVGTVLEGSVRQVGNKLRISAQLIDAGTEEHIWAQDYNRELKDVFAIQSDIAQSVAEALKTQLLVRKKKFREDESAQRETYAYYLKGRYFWNKRTKQGFEKAIENFEKAIEIDPNYAKAYIGLADSYLQLGDGGFISGLEAFSQVEKNALKGLSLNSSLAEAHCTLAEAYHTFAWDWKRAEGEFNKALELNPNYATAHQWFAEYLSIMGRHGEAIVEIQLALELDPLSLIINAVTGWLLYCAGENDRAIEQLHQTMDMDSSFFLTHVYLGRAYLQKLKFKKGMKVLRNANRKFPDNSTVLAALGYGYALSGEHEKAKIIIRTLDGLSKQPYALSYFKGLIYTGLGEKDLALKWLEKTFEERMAWLSWVKVDPGFAQLRTDSRLKELLKKMEP